jgi:hypothetical protein
MVDELMALQDHPAGPLLFDQTCIDDLGHLHMGREWLKPTLDDPIAAAHRATAAQEIKLHDSLKLGRGASWYMTPFWWILGELRKTRSAGVPKVLFVVRMRLITRSLASI